MVDQNRTQDQQQGRKQQQGGMAADQDRRHGPADRRRTAGQRPAGQDSQQSEQGRTEQTRR